jgi:hypothetical protein
MLAICILIIFTLITLLITRNKRIHNNKKHNNKKNNKNNKKNNNRKEVQQIIINDPYYYDDYYEDDYSYWYNPMYWLGNTNNRQHNRPSLTQAPVPTQAPAPTQSPSPTQAPEQEFTLLSEHEGEYNNLFSQPSPMLEETQEPIITMNLSPPETENIYPLPTLVSQEQIMPENIVMPTLSL